MADIENHIVQRLTQVSDVLMNPVKEKKWFEKNRPIFEKELLQQGHVDPQKLFILISAVECRTEEEYVRTGRKIKIGDTEYNTVESIPKTGRVKLKVQFTESIFTIEDYEKMLDKFDLKRSKKVPLDSYTQINEYKNALDKQFNRQASEVEKIHQQMAEEFGALYSHAEHGMLDEHRRNHPKDYKNKLPEGWSDLTLKLHSSFNRIQYGMSPVKIKELGVLDTSLQHKYIDHELAGEISENIMRLCRMREPIIEELRILTKKILPLESIAEDYLYDQEIKSMQSIKEKEAFKDMPDPASFARKIAKPNKDPKGSDVEMITRTLIELRKYLVKKKINKLHGNVSEIIRQLRKCTVDLDAVDNTIRDWINKYYSEYEKNREMRLINS